MHAHFERCDMNFPLPSERLYPPSILWGAPVSLGPLESPLRTTCGSLEPTGFVIFMAPLYFSFVHPKHLLYSLDLTLREVWLPSKLNSPSKDSDLDISPPKIKSNSHRNWTLLKSVRWPLWSFPVLKYSGGLAACPRDCAEHVPMGRTSLWACHVNLSARVPPPCAHAWRHQACSQYVNYWQECWFLSSFFPNRHYRTPSIVAHLHCGWCCWN